MSDPASIVKGLGEETLELPPLDPRCRLSVVIPARNEQHEITKTLEALVAQSDLDSFDVVVLANNCMDATAERARLVARRYARPRIYVIEVVMPAHVAHVGTARRLLMDSAARRFLGAGKPRGIIATTDADTVVSSDWVSQTVAEMTTVDAVAGFVTIKAADLDEMPRSARALYAQEMAFRQAWNEVESLIDPTPEDPLPRHGAFVGASFAVTASMYVQAGALPAVATLEDREFLFALRRVDARIRHSVRVRAYTSGRQAGRVRGGFSTFIRHLNDQGLHGGPLLVEHPRSLIGQLEVRALTRHIWLGDMSRNRLSRLCLTVDLPQERCLALIDRSLTFGRAFERILQSWCNRPNYPLVAVDEAIVMLRAEVASRKASRPIRMSAASGAG